MAIQRLPVFSAVLLAAAFLTPASWAQSVISAHSGVVHYVEGDVAIDGQLTQPKFAEFPEVKNGQVLSTTEGRAEMLLTPGVFLRLSENSSVKMISNALTDTRVEVVTGTALIEVGELLQDNAITIIANGVPISLPKRGLYRVDTDPARLRVYDGQAQLMADDRKVNLKKGREVALNSDLEVTKFDVKDTDAFYRWSGRRTGYIAAANVTSAHVADRSGWSSGFFGGRSSWSWNPYFGMFTFVPGSGIYQSPFGSPFYSPAMIRFVYIPRMNSSIGFGAGGFGSSMSRGPIGPAAIGNPSMGPASLGRSPMGGSSAPHLGGSGMRGGSGGMVSPRVMSGAARGR